MYWHLVMEYIYYYYLLVSLTLPYIYHGTIRFIQARKSKDDLRTGVSSVSLVVMTKSRGTGTSIGSLDDNREGYETKKARNQEGYKTGKGTKPGRIRNQELETSSTKTANQLKAISQKYLKTKFQATPHFTMT